MSKKKKTRREILIGTGLILAFLPVIVVALLETAAAVGISSALTITAGDHQTDFVPMLVVYAAIFTLMILLAYKIAARYVVLVRRLIRIWQENRRSFSAIRPY